MADESGWNITKARSIRIEDDLWEKLEPAARAAGYDRSGVIKQFVRWYLHVPGAQLPQRPPRTGS
jgi:predicted transcriptional regulator